MNLLSNFLFFVLLLSFKESIIKKVDLSEISFAELPYENSSVLESLYAKVDFKKKKKKSHERKTPTNESSGSRESADLVYADLDFDPKNGRGEKRPKQQSVEYALVNTAGGSNLERIYEHSTDFNPQNNEPIYENYPVTNPNDIPESIYEVVDPHRAHGVRKYLSLGDLGNSESSLHDSRRVQSESDLTFDNSRFRKKKKKKKKKGLLARFLGRIRTIFTRS